MSNGISIKEFKMWLEGVEEMQSEGWTPDTRQWLRIREKINTINDTVPSQPQSVQQPPVLYRAPEQQLFNQQPVQMAPSGLQQVNIPAPAPNNALFGNADNPTSPVKTPNVDTSTGTYEPAFI